MGRRAQQGRLDRAWRAARGGLAECRLAAGCWERLRDSPLSWARHGLLESRALEERHPETLLEGGQAPGISESLGEKAGSGPAGEAVEVNEATGHQPAVEDDVEREVQGRTEHITPQPVAVAQPREQHEERQELVRMQRQHDTPASSFEIVPKKGGGTQVALPLEDHVVEDMVDVDKETTRG